jgi:signal transduction histidine kinase
MRRRSPVLLLGGAALVGAVGTAALAVTSIHGAVPTGWPIATVLATLGIAAAATVAAFAEREADRVRRALAAGVAHDIRTPLAQIGMFTEMLLLDRHESEEERRRWLHAIERETVRLGEVLDNVLLFVHGADRDPYVARRPLDLGALVEDVAAGFAARAEMDQTRIEVDPPAGVIVTADPHAMRQLVVNLLDDALRFGPREQTVTVELESRAGEATLRVTDAGPSIPSRRPSTTWSQIPGTHPTGTDHRGCGLAMAVVRQIVEAHDGRCRIEDAPGGGVQVAVVLPRTPASPQLADTPPAQPPSVADPAGATRSTIRSI